jgi:hypothetical protein
MKKIIKNNYNLASKSCHRGKVVNIGYYTGNGNPAKGHSVVILWDEYPETVFYVVDDNNIWEVLKDAAYHNSVFYAVCQNSFVGKWIAEAEGVMRIV